MKKKVDAIGSKDDWRLSLIFLSDFILLLGAVFKFL